MAILTNNVREWEELWRSKLAVDEIFELVVDSAWVGMRKPEPEIYDLTIERLDGRCEPSHCLFVDDNELNVEAARELGLSAVHFVSNDQAIPEIRRGLESSDGGRLVFAADAVLDVDLERLGASCSSRPCDSQGSTMSSASSSPTPARKASSPRKRAASFSASRL